MIFDYETLRIIWWGFLAIILIGFSITGGGDLGVGVLLLCLGKSDNERRIVINAIGANWEGNQVWLIVAGAAIFAAWPLAYAVSFFCFYFVLLLTLFALFLRPLGFDYRSKLPDKRWRENWDRALFVGALVPSIVFGVAFGNLFLGIEFNLDNSLRISYEGSTISYFHPFAMSMGIFSLTLFVMQGSTYLQLKTVGDIYVRSKKCLIWSASIGLVLFGLCGYWLSQIDGYHISSVVMENAPSNPLSKTVKKASGLWLDNYGHFSTLWCIPVSFCLFTLLTMLLSWLNRPGSALICSSVAMAAAVLTVISSLFPFIIPSSLNPDVSLTVWDASSSATTLNLLFWLTIFFLPIIVAYTSWIFKVMRGKVTVEDIEKNKYSVY